MSAVRVAQVGGGVFFFLFSLSGLRSERYTGAPGRNILGRSEFFHPPGLAWPTKKGTVILLHAGFVRNHRRRKREDEIALLGLWIAVSGG